jgi:glycosyltransferase involved in cell wall biosynthesis
VKAHDCLLKSLALVKQRGLDTTMLIAGDGPERDALERLAAELGLGPDRLRFLGFRSDVGDLLNAADFFVLPSRTEGLPLSLLEAMAFRLPVVVTPVGGIPEVITDGRHGALVPVDDPERLSQAIAELVSDPARRASLGAAAYDHARSHFSFEAMLQEYEDLYRQVLGVSHRP